MFVFQNGERRVARNIDMYCALGISFSASSLGVILLCLLIEENYPSRYFLPLSFRQPHSKIDFLKRYPFSSACKISAPDLYRSRSSPLHHLSAELRELLCHQCFVLRGFCKMFVRQRIDGVEYRAALSS